MHPTNEGRLLLHLKGIEKLLERLVVAVEALAKKSDKSVFEAVFGSKG